MQMYLFYYFAAWPIDYMHGVTDVKDDLPQYQSPPVLISFYTDKNGSKLENNQGTGLGWI